MLGRIAAIASRSAIFQRESARRSPPDGRGVEVIALTSVAANLIAIVGGVLIFRDSIGTGPVAIAGRMIAFGLVVAGAALIPAPLRVADPHGRPAEAARART